MTSGTIGHFERGWKQIRYGEQHMAYFCTQSDGETQSTEDLIEGLHNWQLFTVKAGEASRMLSQALLKERH